ncbi:hypothetical protein LELG_04898 [Lodderomyces elongisporus NRRL YB-4239]|uniref:CCZ1/INTU/HSP4 first Longin domain-containing protein n=1 Tax=Lodderomyces elongisporus (strain ATCC 11503 / CBS 2605 / JCM 1781 / NBRC 1676 / NRRL YB-4239) TaxID=379508 RepID=A5E5K9_LODEL|nr:hypothetical protein LELG_04898 [Lodderomyces elongisporus NRRL YB-4239]
MSSYFSFFSQLNRSEIKRSSTGNGIEHFDHEEESLPCQIQYICVFTTATKNDERGNNNDDAGASEKSSQDALTRILVFVENDDGTISSLLRKQFEERLPGLLQGVGGFLQQFDGVQQYDTYKHGDGKGDGYGVQKSRCLAEPLIIKSKSNTLIVLELENDHFFVCSVSSTNSPAIHQLQHLVYGYQQRFTFSQKPLSVLRQTLDSNVLADTLDVYWKSFLIAFNKGHHEVEGIRWLNSLNRAGALLGFSNTSKPAYKQSSMRAPQNIMEEIATSLRSMQIVPHGLIVSSLDETEISKYGFVNCHSVTSKFSRDTLVDVYRYLEYEVPVFSKVKLKMNLELKLRLKLRLKLKLNQKPDLKLRQVATGDRTNLDNSSEGYSLYNPLHLAGNLLTMPIYSVSEYISQRGINDAHTNVYEETNNNENNIQASNWSLVPSFLRSTGTGSEPLATHEAHTTMGRCYFLESDNNHENANQDAEGEQEEEQVEEQVEEEELEAQENHDSDDQGCFFFDEASESGSLKVVYILDYEGIVMKCGLLTFVKKKIAISLIYEDPELEVLNLNNFCNQLKTFVLDDLVDEVESTFGYGSSISKSNLSHSFNSVQSLTFAQIAANLEDGFSYIIYDEPRNCYQTSLSFLPFDVLEKKTVYHIHDQLYKTIGPLVEKWKLLQKTQRVNEFFHKFSTDSGNDWIVYYVKHGLKVIVVVKKQSKTCKNTLYRDTSTSVQVDKSLLNQMSGTISNYANLGFLLNLSDDVKYWLGMIIENSEFDERVDNNDEHGIAIDTESSIENIN